MLCDIQHIPYWRQTFHVVDSVLIETSLSISLHFQCQSTAIDGDQKYTQCASHQTNCHLSGYRLKNTFIPPYINYFRCHEVEILSMTHSWWLLIVSSIYIMCGNWYLVYREAPIQPTLWRLFKRLYWTLDWNIPHIRQLCWQVSPQRSASSGSPRRGAAPPKNQTDTPRFYLAPTDFSNRPSYPVNHFSTMSL